MFKRILPALVTLSIFIAFSGNATASTGSEVVTTHYNDIKLIVNDKLVQTNSEPFVINGVTYVPLRDVSNALGVDVKWNGTDNTVIISKEKQDVTVDNSNTKFDPINPNSDVTKEDKLSEEEALANVLLERHGILNEVFFNKFTISGDNREVEFNVYFNLDENQEAWTALTDRGINDWLKTVINDVQEVYDEDTLVKGSFIRSEDKDVLIDFNKDGDENLKSSFYDGNFRTGVAVQQKLTVESNYMLKHFSVSDIDFKITSVNYRRDHDTADLFFSAVDDNAQFDWDKLSTREKKYEVARIAQIVVNDFANDGNIDLEKVNCTFKDKRNRGLDFYIYDVEDNRVK